MVDIDMMMWQVLISKTATMSEYLLTIAEGQGAVGPWEVVDLCASLMSSMYASGSIGCTLTPGGSLLQV